MARFSEDHNICLSLKQPRGKQATKHLTQLASAVIPNPTFISEGEIGQEAHLSLRPGKTGAAVFACDSLQRCWAAASWYAKLSTFRTSALTIVYRAAE